MAGQRAFHTWLVSHCCTLVFNHLLCCNYTIQVISEKNLELDKKNDRTFIDGYKKIIENVGYFRLDIGHMLMFGVIAVTFNRRD